MMEDINSDGMAPEVSQAFECLAEAIAKLDERLKDLETRLLHSRIKEFEPIQLEHRIDEHVDVIEKLYGKIEDLQGQMQELEDAFNGEHDG